MPLIVHLDFFVVHLTVEMNVSWGIIALLIQHFRCCVVLDTTVLHLRYLFDAVSVAFVVPVPFLKLIVLLDLTVAHHLYKIPVRSAPIVLLVRLLNQMNVILDFTVLNLTSKNLVAVSDPIVLGAQHRREVVHSLIIALLLI